MNITTIHRFGTYAMVILVGMTVAAMAAYYVLVEFIYPNKITDIAPVESRTETQATTTEESMDVGQNEPFKFVGVLGEVGTDCATEGGCFVMVDDRKITAAADGSFGVVGEIQGVDELYQTYWQLRAGSFRPKSTPVLFGCSFSGDEVCLVEVSFIKCIFSGIAIFYKEFIYECGVFQAYIR
jgi:hypothetical protein